MNGSDSLGLGGTSGVARLMVDQARFDPAARELAARNGAGVDDPTRLREVAGEFEALFVKQMVDSMRATLNEENRLVDTGMAGEIFEDMLYDEYASVMAKTGGFGLADMVVERYRA